MVDQQDTNFNSYRFYIIALVILSGELAVYFALIARNDNTPILFSFSLLITAALGSCIARVVTKYELQKQVTTKQ